MKKRFVNSSFLFFFKSFLFVEFFRRQNVATDWVNVALLSVTRWNSISDYKDEFN